MNPGWETVTIVRKGGSSRDALGNRIVVETPHVVAGCSFQPRRLSDSVSDTEFASSTHQVFCPVNSAVLGVKPEDWVDYNGVRYRVIGSRVYRDFHARIAFVKVFCEEQSS